MTSITDLANAALRDFTSDGIPSTGPNNTWKREVRVVFAAVDGQIGVLVDGIVLGASTLKATKALLDADLAHAAGVYAVVLDDPVEANNGLYLKLLGSGLGSWEFKRPYTLPASALADIAYLMQVAGKGPLDADAFGTLAERSAVDAELAGFTYLQTDVDPPVFWFRDTAVAGVWVGPYDFSGAGGAAGVSPWQPLEIWATGVAYVVGLPASLVSQSGASYACAISHTSGVFATDLAAGKWILVASSGSVATATAAEARAGTDAVKGLAPAQAAATRGLHSANTVGGTGSAITFTTTLANWENDPDRVIYLAISATNTVSPVTAAGDGKTALTVKTSDGADIPVGGLVAGKTYKFKVGAGPTFIAFDVQSYVIDPVQLVSLNEVLQYDDSGISIAFDAVNPTILIKDAAAPAKRYIGSLIPKMTSTRTTFGWYFDQLGLLKQAGVNIPRFTYDFKSLAPRGLLVEGARANRVLQNRSLRITHQVTVSGGAGTFTDGETVNFAGGGSGVYRAANSISSTFALSGGSGTMTGVLTGATSGATKNTTAPVTVWAVTNMTVAQSQVGLDGVANSASAITATAANATILQAIAVTSAAYFQTAYIRRLVGTGTLEMTLDVGTTWTAITPADLNWVRMSIPSQTLSNPNVGFRIGTSGDSFAIDCVQNENGNYRTSPMVTTTAIFSRGGEQFSINLASLPFDTTLGSIFVEGRSQGPDNIARALFQLDDGNVNNQIFATLSSLGSGQFSIKSGGTTYANVLTGLTTVDKTSRLAASWGPNYAQAALDGTIGAQDSALTVPTGLTTLRIGGILAGSSPTGGTVAKLTLRLRTMDATELTAWSNFGAAGATPAINVLPNDSNIEDSDHAATLTYAADKVSGVRPIVFGGYQYANPGWRRRFKTRATSVVLHFSISNLGGSTYSAKGQILVDGVHNMYFTASQVIGKFYARLDFASNADRLIEIVMPISASFEHLGLTTYGAPITAPPTRLTMPRAVIHGDSRAQGLLASSIDKSGPELLCRAKGWQHINLGYGSSTINAAWGTDVGNANPDVVIIETDYNSKNGNAALAGFKTTYKDTIAAIRAIKPTVKIFVVSSNWIGDEPANSGPDAANTLGLHMVDYRQQELDAVNELTAAGDTKIFYIDGLTLTTNSTASIGDKIHPGDVGWAEWAASLAPLVSV